MRALTVTLGVACVCVGLVAARVAHAQSRVIIVQQADADTAVVGATLMFQPDGGCALTPLYAYPGVSLTGGGVLSVSATYRPNFGANHPALCAAMQAAAQRALELDVGVGDGGQP